MCGPPEDTKTEWSALAFILMPHCPMQAGTLTKMFGGILRRLASLAGIEPPLPAPDANGNYPAREALAVILARKIIRRRRIAGLSQVELAKRAGVRPETIHRIEQGKHSPSIATVEKLDRALTKAVWERSSG